MIDRLIIALHEFRGRSMGKEPTAIYLGRVTRKRLMAEAKPHCIYAGSPGKREEVCGLPIFVVDEEEHFNVG